MQNDRIKNGPMCSRCVSVSAMAERLANHFACYRPATDLFIQLLETDKVEDAKFMLAVSIYDCAPVPRSCEAESKDICW